MPVRTHWQDLFLLEDTGSIDHLPNSSSTSSLGIGTNTTRILLRVTPNFNYPVIALSNPKDVANSSFTSDEYITSIKNPASANFSLNLDSYSLALLGNSFFQGGTQSSPASGIYLYTMSPYTSSTPSTYLAAIRVLDNTVIEDNTLSSWIWGGIINSLNIQGSSGSIMSIDGKMLAAHYNRHNLIGVISNNPRLTVIWGTAATASALITVYYETAYETWESQGSAIEKATDDDFTDPSLLSAGSVEVSLATGHINFPSIDLTDHDGQEVRVFYSQLNRSGYFYDLNEGISDPPTPLKFQDLIIDIDGSTVNISNISIALTSQLKFNYNHGQEALSITLGRISGTLTMLIPWSDTNYGGMEGFYNYLKSTEHYIQAYWGGTSPDSENEVNIKMNGKLTKINKVEDQGEVSLNTTFDLLKNTSHEAIEILVAYSDSKLSRA